MRDTIQEGGHRTRAFGMRIDSVTALVQLMSKHPLLEPLQNEEFQGLHGRFGEPRALVKEMIQRGWLTSYQATQILQGKGPELQIDKYVILDLVSEGSLGELYRARHQHLRRVVALQVLSPDFLGSADAVERFYREVQTASQISHPHLVEAYDAGPVGNSHFLAMEYVDGVSLERLVGQAGPLAGELALVFMGQAALALQHAYERGLLHHDLKPANLLVTRRGGERNSRSGSQTGSTSTGSGPIVKVRNLGLTLIRQTTRHTRLAADPEEDSSADYQAPETGGRQVADVRSEIYSLGCTCYFLLTGKPPFPGGEQITKLKRHQTEEPAAIEALRPEVPRELAAIVRTMMAKRPEERFRTPLEVAQALKRIRGSPARSGQQRRAAPGKRRASWLLAASILGTLVVLGLVGSFVLILVQTLGAPPPVATAPAAGPVPTYLSDLPEKDARVGYGKFGKNGQLGYSGPSQGTIVVQGKPSPRGISMHPSRNSYSRVAYDLDGKFDVFEAAAAINDGEVGRDAAKLTFKVVGDGKVLWESKPMSAGGSSEECRLSVRGVRELELQVHCPGSYFWARAVWLEPRLHAAAAGR